MERNRDIVKVSLLASLACTLQIMESFIPMPFPGIKIGFANLITLLTLVLFGFRASLYVALVRTIMSSFILGTFLTPAFILSFSGALFSALVMGAMYAANKRFQLFSVIGISIMGALAHNVAQLGIVSLFFIGGKGALWLAPWLGTGAIVTGYVTGLIAARTCHKLQTAPLENNAFENNEPCPLSSLPFNRVEYPANMLNSVRFELKLAVLIFLLVSILLMKSLLFHTLILCSVAGGALLAGVPFRTLFQGIKNTVWLIALTFVFRALWTKGDTLVTIGFVQLTVQGIQSGVIASLRLLIIMTGALGLINTTSPDQIISGLTRIFSPLRIIGINSAGLARRVGLSWNALPEAWRYTQGAIASIMRRRHKSLKLIIVAAARALVILLRRIGEEKAAFTK